MTMETVTHGSSFNNTPQGVSFAPGSTHPLSNSAVDADQVLDQLEIGVACDVGGRQYNEDRSTAFSVRLQDGRRLTVCAVMDGHHQFHVAQMVCLSLPLIFKVAADQFGDLREALAVVVQKLDELILNAFRTQQLKTGGTTLIVHVVSGDAIYTANVGDCKGVLSSKGAPEALSEAHNPPVEKERARFNAAGITVYGDHIGGSDINVCRTIGDWDLGQPLKWQAADGTQQGPLISEPEITVHSIDAIDEFIVTASDGLWDYYTPESTVITNARQKLRAFGNDPQQTADWLVHEAVSRQRTTLHEGTPGDNVTVMVIQLRPLPSIPRANTSRLNLIRRSSASEDAITAGLSKQQSFSESEDMLTQ